MSPHPFQVEPLKRLMKIINAFLSRPDIGPFREPVDWRGLGLDDYPKIVKHRMDLGTVKRKLECQSYHMATQCADDIRLIWSNCMAYNADGSDFWMLAKAFQRGFADRYRKVDKNVSTIIIVCVLSCSVFVLYCEVLFWFFLDFTHHYFQFSLFSIVFF